MINRWEERSVITANLLNPAFCGEIIRRTILNYNQNATRGKFPYSLAFLILPIILHKKTRMKIPFSTRTYFHSWVEQNEPLFIDFPNRAKQMQSFTKESLMFLIQYKAIEIDDHGCILVNSFRKKSPRGQNIEEVLEIFSKADLLGKWLSLTGNEQTIYMFLKIRP